MEHYIDLFFKGYSNFAGHLWHELTHPHWKNYFYWLLLVSLFFFVLEVVVPWRKKQAILRKDFWLDAFYMFFNFFLFWLIIYNAASDLIVNLLNDGIKALSGGFDLQAVNPMRSWPYWAIILIGFLARDFIQWWVHRLLHRVPWLWKFHKVHHSVEQMGFAAHLRYHWMETIVYRSMEYLPLALMGIGLYDFFIIHIFTLSWGHYNHSNISIDGRITGGVLGGLIGIVLTQGIWDITLFEGYSTTSLWLVWLGSVVAGSLILGPIMKYIFNSPEMHIWHHAHDLPQGHKYGVNYGLTLACWDYLFKTAAVPHNGRDIRLGFPGVEKFPDSFKDQTLIGLK